MTEGFRRCEKVRDDAHGLLRAEEVEPETNRPRCLTPTGNQAHTLNLNRWSRRNLTADGKAIVEKAK
jgi:hypothetical protein